MLRYRRIWTLALASLLLQHQQAASAATAPTALAPHQQKNASAAPSAPAPSSPAKSKAPAASSPPAKSTGPASSPPASASPAPSASPPSSAGSVAPSPAKSTKKAPTPAGHGTNGTLDPAQVRALKALGVSVGPDPCNTAAQRNLICDQAAPYSHLIYLQLQYCEENQVFPASVWNNLTTLHSLSFSECPAKQMTLPPELMSSITMLQVVASLGRSVENVLAPGLSGVWLSKFHNLNQLTVQDVDVNASSVGFILNNMTRLQQLTFSNTNLTGPLPKNWPSPNLTSLEISGNDLQGGVPSSLTHLLQLTSLDLSSCNLSGPIPPTIGNLSSLQALKLGSNHLRGPIPVSLQKLASLQYLDLSDNQLNGSVPAFLAHLPGLRYVDLSKNNFRGEIPFNDTFLKSLNTFKAGGNSQLCYNSSIVSAKYVSGGGLQPCDTSGLPAPGFSDLSPSPAPAPQPYGPSQSSHHHGPKKMVLVVAIALASIVAIIAIAIVLSRCCSSKN